MKIVTQARELKAYILDNILIMINLSESSLKDIMKMELYVLEVEGNHYLYVNTTDVIQFLSGWHLRDNKEDIAFLSKHIPLVKGITVRALLHNPYVVDVIKQRLYREFMEGL